jgi:Domain of unknown function (DUF4287)
MTFAAYMTAVEAKTGKSIAELLAIAEAKGLAQAGRMAPGVTAGQIVDWLAADYGLGRGHAMSVYAVLKGKSS